MGVRVALVVSCIGLYAFLGQAYALIELPSNKYQVNDKIPVVVSSISPFDNQGERYIYDTLAWPCKPSHPHQHNAEIGSGFAGERARDSLYNIHFRRATQKQSLCGEKELTQEHIEGFIKAIDKHYEYEMRIDDLPVYGQVGLAQKEEETNKKRYFLITHRHFHLTSNDNRVITCNISRELTTNQYIELDVSKSDAMKVHFTYSVQWSPTTIPYSERWKAQSHAYPSRYQVEAHWLWVLNSSLLVVLLTGLLSMILLRTLKNDVSRYLQLDQIDQEEASQARKEGLMDDVDDSGWKRVKFDVFRPPEYPLLFSAIVGVGAQILMIVIFLVFLAVIGYFYPGNHGRIYVASLLLYSVTAYVAGYIGSSKLKELAPENHDWMFSCGLTASLFAGPFILVFTVVNSVAVYYGSSSALPFATILTVILLWAFVTFPLTAFGAYRGGKATFTEYPSIIKRIARPLPQNLPWYHNGILQVLTAGFLPFMAIYVEVHTIFMSVWGHQPYTLFGILLLTFVILLIVTSFVVILMAYFQLTAEDYRWWWASLFRGAACGIFMYAYAIYYWLYTSHMSGALQGALYFGYTFMVSYAFALMLSAVGHWSSRWFVIKIYNAIKGD